jgi:hypothetical protein
MLIRNVKSNADLVGKKKLQADLLELQVANENELEKRVKDYKNPNKPVPIAPEYKTNAELQKDRLAQERQAIANMEEFGFDYNKSADLVSWLSSSLVNRLVEFNANFRGIKKELVEKTNPKLLTVDYLKNYLENYFEDMDVNFGRKFGKRETDGITQPNTVDELTNLIPIDKLDDMLDAIQDYFPLIMGQIRARNDEIVAKTTDIENFKLALTTEPNAETRKAINSSMINEQKAIKALENSRVILRETYNKLMNVYDLFFLYSKVLPSDQILSVMKQSLTQQERADMIRRYVGVLRKMKILTREGTEELTNELGRGDMSNWLRKANNSLSFLGNDSNLKAIQKIQDDYTFLITHSNRVADAGNIQQLNDIRTKEIEEAKKTIREGRGNEIDVDFDDLSSFKTTKLREPRTSGKIEIEADAQTSLKSKIRNKMVDDEIDAGIENDDRLERERKEGFVRDRVLNSIGVYEPPRRPISNLSKSEIEKLKKPEDIFKERKEALKSDFGTYETKIPLETDLLKYKNTAIQVLEQYGEEQEAAIEELDEIFKEDKRKGIDTARNYLLTFSNITEAEAKKLEDTKGLNTAFYNSMISKIRKFATEKRSYFFKLVEKDYDRQVKLTKKSYADRLAFLNKYQKEIEDGTITRSEIERIVPLYKIEDFDFSIIEDNILRATVGTTKEGEVGVSTRYGIGARKGRGLPKKIIKHLREDDAENKALSKAFKKHMKIEKEVNGDSSDEEKGGALKFKHKKIKVGKGIEVQAQPAYKTFGKYVIHLGHLIDKNVANFKYPSLGSIPSIKPLTVSDDYKDFIMDTLENGKPNERIFSKLPEQEQKHFERVVLGAGLLDAFKLRRTKSDSEKKDADRFNILRGEVMAGNNSDKVIKELRGLIIRFMNEGRIQQKEGTGMLVELSAI